MNLDALWAPKSVAVLGATADPSQLGYAVCSGLLGGGYTGQLYLVGAGQTEILGHTCLPDLKSIGQQVDLCLILEPAERLRASLSQVLDAGAKTVAVLTSLPPKPETGGELQRELARMCAARRVRLLGPNCLGVINVHLGLNGSYASKLPPAGHISVLSQSSALALAMIDWAASRGVGLAKVISIGNKADLDELDLMAAFAKDEQTEVVIGYLESIASGAEFIKVAEQLASIKPVVLLKAGTTRAGERAAAAHMGAPTATDLAYAAAFRRSGVIRAESFQALVDIGRAFASLPLPVGNRVGIVTNAGGPGIMAADAVEHAGLQVAELSPATRERLRAHMPAGTELSNPLDVLGDADPQRYTEAVCGLQADEGVDAVLMLFTPQALSQPAETARAVAGCLQRKRPALAVFMGGDSMAEARSVLVEAGLPAYPSPGRAAGALGAMYEYAAWRRRPPRIITRFPVNRRRAERIIRRQLRLGRLEVPEFQAKEILATYGFDVPIGQQVTNSEEAVEVAERIGYPVALKIVSPDVVHKSDVGGVRLNLTGPEAVRDAFDLIRLRIERNAPQAQIEGLYVEKMIPRRREVIIGMSRDAQFGPMLMFGLGGIFVEVMRDVAFHLAPITFDEAMQMLRSTRSFEVLQDARGRAEVDVAGIATGLQRISQLVTDFGSIQQLEINPFMAGQPGTDPVAVDARILLVEGAVL